MVGTQNFVLSQVLLFGDLVSPVTNVYAVQPLQHHLTRTCSTLVGLPEASNEQSRSEVRFRKISLWLLDC